MYHLQVGQLREVLVHDLLPGSFLLVLEHILELYKGVREVKIDLFGPFFKLGIVLLTINSTPSFLLSLWILALILLQESLLCNL